MNWKTIGISATVAVAVASISYFFRWVAIDYEGRGLPLPYYNCGFGGGCNFSYLTLIFDVLLFFGAIFAIWEVVSKLRQRSKKTQ